MTIIAAAMWVLLIEPCGCCPSHSEQIPEETQFLLLELEGGVYGLILPLIDGGTFRATLRPARCAKLGRAVQAGQGGPCLNTGRKGRCLLLSIKLLGGQWRHLGKAP